MARTSGGAGAQGDPVTSVFGRTGPVVATTGDYTPAKVGALASTADLHTISAANETSGNIIGNGHLLVDHAGVATGAAGANVIVPTFAQGVGAQLSDTARDYIVYLTVGTAGTDLAIGIGPTAAAGNVVKPAGAAATGQVISFRVPSGWYVLWSATAATIANQLAVSA